MVKNKVSLQDWIKTQGGANQVAKTCGFKKRTVNAWLYCERYPRPKSVLIIRRASNNQVDFMLLAKTYAAKNKEK